jgi:hypothetical protein
VEALLPELKEVFDMVSERSEPDLDAWKEQDRRQRRTARNRKVSAYAVTAAMVLALGAIVLGTTADRNGTAKDTVDTRPENVARDFALSLTSLDVDQAAAALADDGDISALVTSLGDEGLRGSPGELPSFVSMLEAMRFEGSVGFCEELGTSSPVTDVRCPFSFSLLGSGEFGRGAFSGSYLDVTIRDGMVARASLQWDIEELSPQMWEPFARWVSRVYPADAELMYADETSAEARLTDDSIRLWEQRVREFVNVFAKPSDSGDSPHRVVRIVDGTAFSLRVPTSWEGFGSTSINKSIVGPQDAEAIMIWTVFPDGGNLEPCTRVLSPNVGPTVTALASAMAAAPGVELITGPLDVTIDGRPAQSVEMTVSEDLGCDPGYFYSWTDIYGGALWPETRVGDTIRLWIVDLGGKLLVVEAETRPQADAELEQEIEEIVGSLRFE